MCLPILLARWSGMITGILFCLLVKKQGKEKRKIEEGIKNYSAIINTF